MEKQIERLEEQNKKLFDIIQNYDYKFAVLEQKLLKQELSNILCNKYIFKCSSKDKIHSSHVITIFNKDGSIKEKKDRFMNKQEFINHIMYECPNNCDFFKKFRCNKRLL